MIDLLLRAYVLGFMFFAGAFVFEEAAFTNPDYVTAVLWAAVWPIALLSGLTIKLFGVGVGDVYENIKERVND